MISLHTNISSIIAQQSLNTSTNRLNRAIEQMSTGFKINHAGDNAANYSISTNMSTQLNSYEVAQDNVSMGLDMVGTASGALDEIQDRLSRIRMLCEQAMNGTYGTDSKNAIRAEVNALVDEIERTYNNVEYNGIDVLRGNPIETLEGDFIKEVNRRNTDNMTSLSLIDPTERLESGTYSISTAAELAQLATMTNNGLIGATTEFVMANDIDLSDYTAGEGWTPIGRKTKDESGNTVYDYSFQGLFDGNGYKITNLKINRAVSYVENKFVGLFGFALFASIANLRVEDADIKGSQGGILVGYGANSNISNCSTSGSIQTANRTGGLAGHCSGNIDSCYSTATINGGFTGGIAGYTDSATFIDCYYDGNITCTNGYAGGIVDCATGSGTSYFKNCYSSGTITNTGTGTSAFAGGIIGSSKNVVIENCYSSSLIQANKPRGGLIGQANTDVSITIKDSAVLNSSSNLSGLFIGKSNTTNITIENSSYNSGLSATKYVGNLENSACTTSNITTNDGTPAYTISNDKGIKVYGAFSLQVGIYSDDTNNIAFDTNVNILDNVKRLKLIGRNNLFTTKNALPIIDSLISQISAKQTSFGAVQNRLESALESIGVNIENLTKSRSTLRDADIGEVSSQFIRQQILQQATATLMSTANQSPAIALQLI